MKTKHLLIAIALLSCGQSYAQSGRELRGTVRDTLKQTITGSTVTLTSELHESMTMPTDISGEFVFRQVKGNKIDLTISAIGYQTFRHHYTFSPGKATIDLQNIVLKRESNTLKEVNHSRDAGHRPKGR